MRSVALAALAAPSCAQRGVVGEHRHGALLQTWGKELQGSKGTPVTRVVGLLKEMTTTLKKEMDEDEALYEKLECWCNTGRYDKEAAIEAGTAKIEQLEGANEQGFARSKELATKIKELGEQIAADKQELATATAQREAEVQAFQGLETDSIQAIGNMDAALVVLDKNKGAAFPQMSFLQTKRRVEPMDVEGERSLEGFMQAHDFDGADDRSTQKFLQQDANHANSKDWTNSDVALVRKALKQANAFAQVHGGSSYFPSHQSQTGAIVGIIKEMKEQMEGELKEAQAKEQAAASTFSELRAAKTAAIEAAEKMEEQKEAEKADTDNLVAEAKEDLGQTQEILTEDKTYLANLDKMCANGDSAFEKRKASRLEEIKAVTETIEILTADEARDAMTGTYSFVQVSSNSQIRKEAAAVIRGINTHNQELALLASSVELDAFTKVKKAIDDMIATLKQQQSDEVKKNDYCKAELQKNEMTIMKTEDLRDDINAKIGSLESAIVTLTKEIADAKAAIAQAQIDLQRASEDRQVENLDFQKTIADQTTTIEVLHKAMDRLAQFYDQEELVQVKKQTPPVQQMEYKPNAGAGGVMSMIEKLIYDAKDLMANSKKSENEAQAAYEQMVADTNRDIDGLTNEVATKTGELAKAKKDKIGAEGDLTDTIDELEGLSKYNADLHAECDYTMKNFNVRQQGRAEEIEGLQNAKQILDGANLS